MVRGKFSFPIPGRRSQKKAERDGDAGSTPSIPSTHEWSSRPEDSSSKAHRVLGTSEPMYRTTSKQSALASPGYMSITVSEASFNSQADDRTTDYNGHAARPDISRRPSSNIIGRAYSGDGRRGSEHSAASHRLHPQNSNSTMRSHYDPKSSPLSISQQTSDSAVRDRALRRGHPQVGIDYHGSAVSPVSPMVLEQSRKKEQRKSKPAKLDLSKLFPKPRAGEGPAHSNALLSPTKMVNSPAAMSVSSEYPFPRPMTREPTPNPPKGPAKLTKTSRQPQMPGPPMRKFQRDEYDNAKVHVRRPPKGVRHWFDALDEEESDEALETNPAPLYAPTAVRPNTIPKLPLRQANNGLLAPDTAAQSKSHTQRSLAAGRKDTFTHEDLIDLQVDSPSQVSLRSTKTKESALSKNNLQDSSILSFSSSEDELDGIPRPTHRVAVRKSLDFADDADEVIIGQAQAFEVRPHNRRPSAMSTLSTSTNAATIEVMYTPEPPFSPFHYPRSSNYSSRRSSHARQPSVIPEDDDVARPRTAINMPLSPSAHSMHSARTSASEPQPRSEGSRKLMSVTAEEEALLELMRKKRAAMGMKEPTQPSPVPEQQNHPQRNPIASSRHHYRTSGFLAEASPVRVVETQSTRRASTVSPSPLLQPPRGRPSKSHYDANLGQSQFRDSSASDAWSDRHSSPASRVVLPHHIPTPSEFSPLDPFPPSSPVPTASLATTDHASPLPSPITPGLRAYEKDLNVKVASSDTSNDSDPVAILDTGVIDTPSESTKSSASTQDISAHRRRRTASSGANVSFPAPPTHGLTDLTPVTEHSSRHSSIAEAPPVPKLPIKNAKRMSGLTLLTQGSSRSRQGSVHSSHSQSSHASGFAPEKKGTRRVSRQGSATSMNTAAKAGRSSVSDDVLAAWNSLGGTY